MPLSDDAEIFMKYDFAEFKDLCKQFLTLVSGILVFSVTFAEKIVGLQSHPGRWLLVLAWIGFIVAIVLCGIALGYFALAGGRAVLVPLFENSAGWNRDQCCLR